jgi:predicted O-methyltransferase YrrM
VRAIVKALIPNSLLRYLHFLRESRSLRALATSPCNVNNLRRAIPDIQKLDITPEWESVITELAPLQLGDKGGAVNPGDRRAIYYLTRALQPRAVLEIGTHLGASTGMFALALRNSACAAPTLVTVDILDVNGPDGAWVRLGVKQPPRSALHALRCDFVDFVTTPSLDFLRNCKQRFDLIFLDGGHEASTVYQEVPAALELLNPNGLILLHDYYTNGKPLWSDGALVVGPWLAIERFKKEGVSMTAKPLGALPWPTKLESNVTSLAYLIRATPDH